MRQAWLIGIVAAAGVAVPFAASAQYAPPPPSTEVLRLPGEIPARAEPGGNGVAANGRCGGISYGTGARRCGDATGGAVPDNGSRD